MKTNTTIFLLILLASKAFCQSEVEIKRDKWDFGLELFPNYSIISKKYSNKFAFDGYSVGDFKESFSFRFVANKKLNKFLSLYLGAGVQFTGEQVNRTLFYIGDETIGYDTVFHNLSNTQFSLGFNARITKRFYFHNAASVLINFNNRFSDQTIENFDKFKFYNYSDLQNKTLYSFSYQAGIGFYFIRRKEFKAYIQPNFEVIVRNNRKEISPNKSVKMYGLVLGTRF